MGTALATFSLAPTSAIRSLCSALETESLRAKPATQERVALVRSWVHSGFSGRTGTSEDAWINSPPPDEGHGTAFTPHRFPKPSY